MGRNGVRGWAGLGDEEHFVAMSSVVLIGLSGAAVRALNDEVFDRAFRGKAFLAVGAGDELASVQLRHLRLSCRGGGLLANSENFHVQGLPDTRVARNALATETVAELLSGHGLAFDLDTAVGDGAVHQLSLFGSEVQRYAHSSMGVGNSQGCGQSLLLV